MIDYITISTLNDFIFCPYSIYLHNVYMESGETMYHATPQTQGRVAHETVDRKTAKKFEGGDSVIIFDASAVKLKKYGNAIHRDTDIVYF